MRDEFYGDRKDVWKWTVVLDEAASRSILYVAMYRPDEKRKHPLGVRETVSSFFLGEWATLNEDRKCSRIANLCGAQLVPFFDVYHPRNSKDYFGRVKQALGSRPKDSSYLVFVDPDTGIADELSPAHITPRQISSLWESMVRGDSLLVYQHYARRKVDEWVREKLECLAGATGCDSSDITCRHHSGVCFFILRKKDNSGN